MEVLVALHACLFVPGACYQPVDVMISINKRSAGGGSACKEREGGKAQAKQHCCCQCCAQHLWPTALCDGSSWAGWCESCRAGSEPHSCPLTEEI